jgi:serine phosphatase RsbU (regulator of sigma subunit)
VRNVPLSPDTAVDLVDATAPWAVADAIVARAAAVAGAPCALYVVDIGGSTLQRVAGCGADEIAMPLTLGPELPERHAEEVIAALADDGLHVEPLWLRGRAVAALAFGRTVDLPPRFAREAAGAIDLAARYTDRFESARRRTLTTPAAELQETLLPARVAEVRGADLAGTVLPAYEVGSDWFDYAEDADGTWLAVGDAAGKGPRATALSALVLGALRGERRQGRGLDAVVAAMHRVIHALNDADAYLTAIVGRWDPARRVFEHRCCGHPAPLVLRAGGAVEECETRHGPPLGVPGAGPPPLNVVELAPDDRLVLYSDGITERRSCGGEHFGVPGLKDAMAAVGSPSAASLATCVLQRVLRVTEDPLEDDATFVALRAR